MLLKVGELAKHAGVTDHDLHHYDEIGLLRPSSGSESGDRLYNDADIARLHAIQALGVAGMPLAEIALIVGEAPAVDVFAFMDRPRFSADEIAKIGGNWPQVREEWSRVIEALSKAMADDVPPDALEVMPLMRQWWSLMLRWLDGDMDLIARWGAMYESGRGPAGSLGPSRELTFYVLQGFEAHDAVLRQYVSAEELELLSRNDASATAALSGEVQRFVEAGGQPSSPEALQLLVRYGELLDRTTGGDADLKRRLLDAVQREPIVAAASPLSPASRDFLGRVAAAHGLA
jgi:DNA-binding transcriptional MerR regulator